MRHIPRVNEDWAMIETEVFEVLGKKYFVKNPPRYWGGLDQARALRSKEISGDIDIIYKELIRREVRCFKRKIVLFNRYMGELVSEKFKILVHSVKLRKRHENLFFAFDYKTVYVPVGLSERRIEQIVEELCNASKQVDGKKIPSMDRSKVIGSDG